jgi:hypothetical protein
MPKGQRKMEARVVAAGCGTPKERRLVVGHAARRGPHHCAQGAFTVVLKAHETREAMVAATVLLTASHATSGPR